MRRRYMKLGYFTVTIYTELYASVTVGSQSITSDSSGKATFLLKKGNYIYTIKKDGYDTKSGSFTITKDQSFTFNLSREKKTVLLMHCNQNAKDEIGHKSTLYNSPDYVSGKFEYCLNFNGSGSIHFDDAGFGDIINNNQWTIEFWCYPLSSRLTNSYMISSWYSGRYQFTIHGGSDSYGLNPHLEIRRNGGGEGTGGTCSQAMSNNRWNHVAFVRNGGLLGFVNGIGGSLMSYTPMTQASIESRLDIGYKADTDDYKSGFRIDELRISKVARYLSNFTPSQSPFVVD